MKIKTSLFFLCRYTLVLIFMLYQDCFGFLWYFSDIKTWIMFHNIRGTNKNKLPFHYSLWEKLRDLYIQLKESWWTIMTFRPCGFFSKFKQKPSHVFLSSLRISDGFLSYIGYLWFNQQAQNFKIAIRNVFHGMV